MEIKQHRTKNKKILSILVLLIIITLAVRVVDIDKPYETWDEITTYSIGLNLWFNILKGDFSPETWKTYNVDFTGSLHPPLARYTYGIVNGVYIVSKTGFGLFSATYDEAVHTMFTLKNLAPGRLLSAAFAAATAVLIFLITRKHFNLKVAILSSLIFALLPASIAQTKLAALDAMLVFMYTITVYLFIKGLESKKYFYLAIIFVGLSIATKYNSVTLFGLLPAIYFAFRGSKVISKRYLLLIPVVSLAVLFLIWPRLWPDPIGGALSNIDGWLAMGGGNVGEYFLGQFETRHSSLYEIVYVMATTPVLLLFFFLVGLIISLKEKKFGNNILLLWFFLPLIIYSLFQFKMSGPRFVFMIYPAFAALIAIGIWRFADYLRSRKFGLRNVLYYATFAVIFVYLMATLVLVHPYYLDYYNEAIGGPKNAYENNLFVVGRFGEGIGEAAFYLYDHAENGSSVQFFVMPRHVIPPLRSDMNDLTPFIPKYLSSTGFNENWDLTNTTPEADYLVENTFFRVYMNSTFNELIGNSYTLIHTVEVQGAPLAWVYKKI